MTHKKESPVNLNVDIYGFSDRSTRNNRICNLFQINTYENVDSDGVSDRLTRNNRICNLFQLNTYENVDSNGLVIDRQETTAHAIYFKLTRTTIKSTKL